MYDFSPLPEILSTPRKIAITTHYKPDGDAMGSSLGLFHFLKDKGHSVTVVTPSDYPEFLHWMPGHSVVVDAIGQPAKAKEAVKNAELIFCLDFNAIHRCESVGPMIAASGATKIVIDHHLHPEAFANHSFIHPEASSTSELIYHFIVFSGGKESISASCAECLYTGIMTDTASFRFSIMKADTHRIIADLMEAGAENFRIHELIYDSWTENRIRLVAFATGEKMRVLPDYRTAIMDLSQEELNKFNHQTGDTEGIVNIPLSIKEIKMSAFFVERRKQVKISFRSKDDFNVRDLAAAHFEGGGHLNAAGGMSLLSLKDTVDKFLDILPNYLGDLNR